MCGCNKNKILNGDGGVQSMAMSQAVHTPSNGTQGDSIKYTRVALRRDVEIPEDGIALPPEIAQYAHGSDTFAPKQRITVVPTQVAQYLRREYAELFL